MKNIIITIIIILGLASCGKTDCYECVWKRNGFVKDEAVVCDMSEGEAYRLEKSNTKNVQGAEYSLECSLKGFNY